MMQTRTAKLTVLRQLAVGGVALAVTASTGCKSAPSIPGASMFGWKKSPSAETLAGQGPTTTYPSAPSNAFTPNAIASNAAGTGARDSATGLNPSDIATGVPATAAQANGFAAGPAGYSATPPSYAQIPSTAGTGSTPSYTAAQTPPGYASAQTPPGYASPQGATLPTGQAAYGGSSASASMGQGYVPSSYPNAAGPAAQVASAAAVPNYGNGSLPTGGYTNPSPSAYQAPGVSAPSTSPYAMPAINAGAASSQGYAVPSGYVMGTNSAQSNPYSTPANGATAEAGNEAESSPTPASGYRPGSTSNATSYPAAPYTTPSGSVYR